MEQGSNRKRAELIRARIRLTGESYMAAARKVDAVLARQQQQLPREDPGAAS